MQLLLLLGVDALSTIASHMNVWEVREWTRARRKGLREHLPQLLRRARRCPRHMAFGSPLSDAAFAATGIFCAQVETPFWSIPRSAVALSWADSSLLDTRVGRLHSFSVEVTGDDKQRELRQLFRYAALCCGAAAEVDEGAEDDAQVHVRIASHVHAQLSSVMMLCVEVHTRTRDSGVVYCVLNGDANDPRRRFKHFGVLSLTSDPLDYVGLTDDTDSDSDSDGDD